MTENYEYLKYVNTYLKYVSSQYPQQETSEQRLQRRKDIIEYGPMMVNAMVN